jgi:hypothetical protein
VLSRQSDKEQTLTRANAEARKGSLSLIRFPIGAIEMRRDPKAYAPLTSSTAKDQTHAELRPDDFTRALGRHQQYGQDDL